MQEKELFSDLKKKILNLDPVFFCENYLTLDGRPFRLNGSGYKPFSDIYRYIGIKALEKDSKPVIMVKGRQVGGTTMASALEMYFMGSGLFGNTTPPIRAMHLFPLLESSKAYSKSKLSPMIASSLTKGEGKAPTTKIKSYMETLLDGSTESNNSLSFKQFMGGNQLWIDSTGLDADRIRGRSCDVMFFDEVQDMTGLALANAKQILSKAKYGRVGDGVQVYFGTPKKKGSEFYKMWAASSQQYYHLGCESCKKHFPLYTPGTDEWEKIWIHTFIVRCTHCGHEQDKRLAAERGKWVGIKDISDPDCQYVGFHLNQLYMPDFPKEKILAEKPGTHAFNTERAYQNEVLGEFFQGDSSPVTMEDIIEICGDLDRPIVTSLIPEENEIIVMGVDYGLKADLEQMANPNSSRRAGQSYTSAVILRVKGPNLFHIEYAVKFKQNDMTYKKELIEQLIRNFGVKLTIGDIGFSQDFSTMLHMEYGDRYLVSRAHNSITNKVKFVAESVPKEIVFERDFYLGEMFEHFKNGRVRFPLKKYDRIDWLINHCCSMDIKPSISKYGDPTIHYVKGPTPNDGLMALLNAYLAYQYLVTDAFTNRNPLASKTGVIEKKVMGVLGHVHRRF